MKALFALVLASAVTSNVASAAGVKFNCTNVKDADEEITLSVTTKDWHIIEANGGYWGKVKDGIDNGKYILFKSPDSTVSRGDGTDDISIQKSLLNDSLPWETDEVAGHVLIVSVDEDGKYSTAKFACK